MNNTLEVREMAGLWNPFFFLNNKQRNNKKRYSQSGSSFVATVVDVAVAARPVVVVEEVVDVGGLLHFEALRSPYATAAVADLTF